MDIQTPLNKAQLEILQLFSREVSNEDMLEIKRMITRYFAKKVNTLADEVWEEKGWTQDDMERLSQTHMRTS